jgi:hypothetical protein
MFPRKHPLVHNVLLMDYVEKVLNRETDDFIIEGERGALKEYLDLRDNPQKWKGDVNYGILKRSSSKEPELDFWLTFGTKQDKDYTIIYEFKSSLKGFNGSNKQLLKRVGTNNFTGRIFYVGVHPIGDVQGDWPSSYFPKNIKKFAEKIYYVEDSTAENYEFTHREKKVKTKEREHSNGYRRPGLRSRSYAK